MRALAVATASIVVFAVPARAQEQASAASTAPCSSLRCTTNIDESAVTWLTVPRALLAPVRVAFRTAAEVAALGLGVEEELQIREFATDIFFDDTRTFGVFPTAFYETGMSPNVGARLLHRDLLSRRELLLLRAGYGGSHDQIYQAKLDSGERWKAARLWSELSYRLQDDRKFYGVGNADAVDPDSLATTIDPLQTDAAIETRYRSRELRTAFGAWIALVPGARLLVSEVLRQRRFGEGADVPGETPWVNDVYEGGTVLGFERDLVDSYSELRLRLDAPCAKRPDLPQALCASGWRAIAWSGLQHELTESQNTFGRFGLDLQGFIDLYRGNRVLRLRLYSSWVTGSLERIPFADLPPLGGARLLRGHESGRFRGRGTLLASAEYRYPVAENVASYLFVDGGRPYEHLEELSLASLADLRLGFGGGLVIHNRHSVALGLQIASSIDGGLFFALRLDTSDDVGREY
jgi:hypothetical protein